MNTTQAIMLGAGITTVAILIVVILFRRSIVSAIESGRFFGIDIGLRGAKLLVGPSVTDVPSPEVPETEIVPTPPDETPDPKLVRFIPPLPPGKFRIAPLPRPTPPPFYNWPYAPTGKFVIYDIPFFLLPVGDDLGNLKGHLVLTVQPSNENIPDVKEIRVQIDNVIVVHILISAGHGWRSHKGVDFLHRRIGYVDLHFADGMSQREPLILGKNLREWAFGNSPNLVTELDMNAARPAWLSHDSTKRIDLLSIPIGGGAKDIHRIELVGKFEVDHPGKSFSTPATIISAVTLERTTPS